MEDAGPSQGFPAGMQPMKLAAWFFAFPRPNFGLLPKGARETAYSWLIL
jgi:hypothetical protein